MNTDSHLKILKLFFLKGWVIICYNKDLICIFKKIIFLDQFNINQKHKLRV